MKKLIQIATVFMALVGCGIKGDPLPPSEQETIQKQTVIPAAAPLPTPAAPVIKKKKK